MRIRKFNEDIDSTEIVEYIKDCFVDFIDDGADIEEFVSSDGNDNLAIKIRIPSLQFSWILKNEKIYSIFEDIKKASEISEEIQQCLEMILSRFDESKLDVESSVSNGYIQLHFKSLIL